ncbi:MAG: SLBB domain-containing protein [Gemmatimonadetes bacterium]|nr:SLBB domain-containing protein [Gemmatimonadota bacterium]
MISTFVKRAVHVGLAVAVTAGAAFAQNPPPTPPPVQPPVVVVPQTPTAAQAAAASMGKSVSNEQISDAIKRSGLSEAQIRSRLQSAGYDAALADPFFKQGQQSGVGGTAGGAGGTGATSDFARALQNLGLLSVGPSDNPDETPKKNQERVTPHAGGVFGKDIFDRATTAFDPVTSGPVDAAYRLGVGDALQVIVTGQVELAYQLDIRRDGSVVIPQVGQLSLAGLTLDAARELLKSRMGKSYSGLLNGEARLDLSIARLRSNAVFVIGEVEQPGAIQVNALATVFHAIARAGGPTERGSFRDIEVRRGNKVIERLDLYDYLLNGNAAGDIRLEQGDVIFVPLNRRVVAVMGAVRRPRIFELRENEGFSDLLRFAGGLMPTASVERVQIDRVVPADKRTPGFERVKVDVELKGKLDSLAKVKLLDGDIVSVFSIGDVRRNVVTVDGQVFQPGEYELKPGATLGTVLDDAQGLMPWALPTIVKVIRQVPTTGRSELFSVDVSQPAGRSFAMQEFDAISVLDARTAFPIDSVQVMGAVVNPSKRLYVEHETLRDAIERSGGFTEDAQAVEVARRRVGATYSDTTSVVYRFNVTPGMWSDPSVASFVLARDDRVSVFRSPGFRQQRAVTVFGQFEKPGTYAITENRDRVHDLVARAGGVLPGGYGESFRLVREGRPVSVDFAKAMKGDPANDLPLLGGDSLTIDRDPQTVLVTGAVNRVSLIKFSPGRSVSEYVAMAGGPTEKGDRGKTFVEYPSGFSRRVERVALFFHSEPPVVSGSVITVPEKPEDKGVFTQSLQQTLSIVSTLMTLVIAYATVRKL